MSTSGTRGIGGLVERQMRNWEIAKDQSAKLTPGDVVAVKPFVTVSRMHGSGGEDIARAVAEKVKWPLFDKEILQYMAGDDSVRRRLYEIMDERDHGFIEETMRTFSSAEVKRNDYFHRLTETILAISRQGSAVFLGRGADLVLPRESGLRVRVISTPQQCVESYAREHNLSLTQAENQVKEIEGRVMQFTQQHFHVAADHVGRFDLIINTRSLSVEHAVELILTGARVGGLLSA